MQRKKIELAWTQVESEKNKLVLSLNKSSFWFWFEILKLKEDFVLFLNSKYFLLFQILWKLKLNQMKLTIFKKLEKIKIKIK